MEKQLNELDCTLLEVYDQMVTLERLLRDLTSGLKHHGEYLKELTGAINNAVAELIG